MTAVAVLLVAGALSAGWLAPVLLARLDVRRHDPRQLILAWLASMATATLTAEAAVLMLLTHAHQPGAPLPSIVHRCWSAIRAGSPPRVEDLLGLVGMALMTAFTVRAVIVSVRGVRRLARKHQQDLAVLRLAARPATDAPDVLWLAHERPLAFSMAGHPGVVVATEGLSRHLREDAVAAVFAHERAHLTERHHHLVAVADELRAALPFVPLFRQAPRAIRDLVELAADASAVRTCGPAAVHAALLKLTAHGAPPMSLAMALDAVDLRLARLRHGVRPPSQHRQNVLCELVVVTAAVLPVVSGAGLLLGVALIVFPF